MTKTGETYYSPTPLDFLLLQALPQKGVLGGVHWAGRPARHVRDEINEALESGVVVAVSTVQARLRSMKVAGHVEDFPSHGSGRIWARTVSGSELLSRREEVLGA